MCPLKGVVVGVVENTFEVGWNSSKVGWNSFKVGWNSFKVGWNSFKVGWIYPKHHSKYACEDR